MRPSMKIIETDPWLEPYAPVIKRRAELIKKKESELTADSENLESFSTGHLYFGIHRTEKDWIFRDWMPNAKSVHLIGEFNDWSVNEDFALSKISDSTWELKIPLDYINHGDQYKLKVTWNNGSGDRIPAWALRTVQIEETGIFNAQVWSPREPYKWKFESPDLSGRHPVIYEAHVGMATEGHNVGTFRQFREQVLPRVIESGYNTLQLMAIQEHPYYGSFGYHVSGLFAVSSRFGTPDDLKNLIDEAHQHGIAVIMDIVHSHAVKNELEGLGMYAGDPGQFFHTGHRREHTGWDSLCYDYGKNEVLHFLLSNVHFWLKEYRFDGFRFDGVTSMLYYDHGLERAFSSYNNYFDGGQDEDAIVCLALANKLITELKPDAISIAEDMSGYPGLAAPLNAGGIGFTHRLSMGVPDYWIRIIKEKADENWNMTELFHELTSKRPGEEVIAYAESHDQALVGDKTIIFRLVDKEMYWHMNKSSENLIVDRGIALHKMIRLITLATAGGGYLNFMGNEFGHPEWIDFPREGNNWSYQYARRQWSLVDNMELKYHYMGDFDREIITLIVNSNCLEHPCNPVKIDDGDKIISFSRGKFLFVFNFHPSNSYTSYGLPADQGKYRYILSSDEARFGGFERVDLATLHRTTRERSFGLKQKLDLYIPARTALVLEKSAVPGVR
ncbi:MAG: alpha amylase C-terminal domain-containing protein [Bacteroidales bacterium]|nr:alpha amylase C-terminal domain-containing protein [Bacteroidales bacterium]